jgi:hypothetical protein
MCPVQNVTHVPGPKRHPCSGLYNPGLTYNRSSVEVAVRITSPITSLDEEMRLIARLKPRDNLIGQSEPIEEVPF